MGPKAIFELVKDAFKHWRDDKASRLGAALAYYTIFAIGPLLLIITALVGFVFGEAAVRGEVSNQVRGALGEDGAEMVETMVQNAGEPTTGTIATAIGIITLLLAASGLFGQLQDALNTIWGVKLKPDAGLKVTIINRLMTFLMVLVVGVLLMASLAMNAALAVVGDVVGGNLPGGALLWQLVSYAATIAVMAVLFAIVYKVLPDVKIAWKDVWVGAVVTALLFTLGQIGLGFYLANSNVGSAYGAAGSLVVLLVWIYYAAQIFFFGAEITQVYAQKYGSGIRPEDHAMLVSAEERASQGMEGKKETRQAPEDSEARKAPRLRSSPWFG
jgi:membrane protein